MFFKDLKCLQNNFTGFNIGEYYNLITNISLYDTVKISIEKRRVYVNFLSRNHAMFIRVFVGLSTLEDCCHKVTNNSFLNELLIDDDYEYDKIYYQEDNIIFEKEMKKEYNSITNKKYYVGVEESENINIPRYLSSKRNHFEDVTISNSCLKFLTNFKNVKCKLRCDKDYKKLIISCFNGSVPEYDDYSEAIIEMPLLKGEGVNSKIYFNLGFLSECLSKFNFSMLDHDNAILKWGTDRPLFVKYKNYECMIAPIIPY